MKTVMREDMHPVSNGRVEELHPDTNPTMERPRHGPPGGWTTSTRGIPCCRSRMMTSGPSGNSRALT